MWNINILDSYKNVHVYTDVIQSISIFLWSRIIFHGKFKLKYSLLYKGFRQIWIYESENLSRLGYLIIHKTIASLICDLLPQITTVMSEDRSSCDVIIVSADGSYFYKLLTFISGCKCRLTMRYFWRQVYVSLAIQVNYPETISSVFLYNIFKVCVSLLSK